MAKSKNEIDNDRYREGYNNGRHPDFMNNLPYDVLGLNDEIYLKGFEQGRKDREKYEQREREKVSHEPERREARRKPRHTRKPSSYTHLSRHHISSSSSEGFPMLSAAIFGLLYLAYCYWVFDTYPSQRGISGLGDVVICVLALPGIIFGAFMFALGLIVSGIVVFVFSLF